MLPEDIGFVIGTGGVTINNIKKTANAQVQIYKPIKLGGTTNETHPYFLIQAKTQESIDIAFQMIEKIAKESYNRRHGVFHHSCPPEKRFVPPPKPSPPPNPKYQYKDQTKDFRYMIIPCQCVLNFPPMKTQEDSSRGVVDRKNQWSWAIPKSIEKKTLENFIGKTCSRCNQEYTHAKHVSPDTPITKIYQNDLVITMGNSDSDSDSESE